MKLNGLDISKMYLNGSEISKALLNGTVIFQTGTIVPPVITPSSDFIDTFTRIDNNTTLGVTETGQTWIAQNPSIWGIKNGMAYLVSVTTGRSIITIESGYSDAIIEMDSIYFVDNSTGGGAGIAFRVTDSNNFYHAVVDASGLVLRKSAVGTYTTLGSFSFQPVNNTTYHIQVILNGSNIKILLNGTQSLNITDSFNLTATKHGLRATGFNSYFDNFKITV